jgi:hypothetical protein
VRLAVPKHRTAHDFNGPVDGIYQRVDASDVPVVGNDVPVIDNDASTDANYGRVDAIDVHVIGINMHVNRIYGRVNAADLSEDPNKSAYFGGMTGICRPDGVGDIGDVVGYKEFATDGARGNRNAAQFFSPTLADAVGLSWVNVREGKQL